MASKRSKRKSSGLIRRLENKKEYVHGVIVVSVLVIVLTLL